MKLSIIVPCYNEEKNIKNLYDAFVHELINTSYEVIFIDDGSSDKTFFEINQLYKNGNKCIKAISFSRNCGKESAIYAGIKNATGEYTAIIDADLQQNPKYLVSMMKYLDEHGDTDQIAMYQKTRNDKTFKSYLSSKFYKVINKLGDVKFRGNASDFRMSRKNVRSSIL